MTPNKLTQPFSEELFSEITEQLIGHDFTKDNRNISIADKNLKFIKEVKNLGHYPDLNLQVFIVRNSSDNDARIGLSKELFGIMKEYSFSNALIATYNDGNNWRYSLLTSNLSIANDGRVVRSFSNPKRYSYLLGIGAKVVTPYKYLIKNGKISDFEDLQKRFSVEVVNKEFYENIANLFTELVGGTRKKNNKNVTYEGLLELPANNKSHYHDFAVRLIGRVVFCWFLKQKKSQNGSPLLSPEIFSLESSKKYIDYYERLETLFFKLLNTDFKDRDSNLRQKPFNEIPYLNGGLFEPHVGDYYKKEKTVPNQWIIKLFTLLDTYNFTIDENTPVDVELSIDPEMLGRIFENLLAEINPDTNETARKNTGSYYTPRHIVENMVDTSLINYLLEHTGIDQTKISALMTYDTDDDSFFPLTESDKKKIAISLNTIKIIDPACGSGAFPIGILQKVLLILQRIDPSGNLWIQMKLSGLKDPIIKELLKDKFENENLDYVRKLGLIRDSIYGVDIQAIATEVSRLRCFLTLIVDETIDESKYNRGLQPLPNLNFKFITANSLISLRRDTNLSLDNIFGDLELKLTKIRDEYFNAKPELRNKLKLEYARLLDQTALFGDAATDVQLKTYNPFDPESCASFFDSYFMFGVTKFDIVIANPPWGAKLSIEEKKILKDDMPEIDSSTPNTFAYFIGLGLKLTKGRLAYVLPDSILIKDYSKTRKLIKDKLSDVIWYQNTGIPEKLRPFVYVEHDVCVIITNKISGSVNVTTNIYNPTKNRLESTSKISSKDQVIRGYFDNIINLKATHDDYILLDKIMLHQPLKSFMQCHEGIHTGNSRDILFKKETFGHNIKPLFYGAGAGDKIANYYSSTSGWFVDYDSALINKSNGNYASLRNEEIFCNPKIYITRTGNPFKAFIDKDTYASNNFFSLQYINYEDNSIDSLKIIMPFIISKVAQYFIRTFAAPRMGDAFIETKITHLLRLPIPELDGATKKQLIDLIDKLPHESSDMRDSFEKNIQNIIYKAYDFTNDEIEIVEEATK